MVDLIYGGVIATFVAQFAAMGIDEVYCHRRRGLPLWEKIGHPLDSFVFSVTTSLPAFLEPNARTKAIYIIAAVFSMLIVTKDEWVHKARCSGFEQWLHALLYMIHALSLAGLAWLWFTDQGLFLRRLVPVASLVFGIYQIYYWKGRSDVSRDNESAQG
jgi:hypothetical protein